MENSEEYLMNLDWNCYLYWVSTALLCYHGSLLSSFKKTKNINNDLEETFRQQGRKWKGANNILDALGFGIFLCCTFPRILIFLVLNCWCSFPWILDVPGDDSPTHGFWMFLVLPSVSGCLRLHPNRPCSSLMSSRAAQRPAVLLNVRPFSSLPSSCAPWRPAVLFAVLFDVLLTVLFNVLLAGLFDVLLAMLLDVLLAVLFDVLLNIRPRSSMCSLPCSGMCSRILGFAAAPAHGFLIDLRPTLTSGLPCCPVPSCKEETKNVDKLTEWFV